jgi:hypothetical protein
MENPRKREKRERPKSAEHDFYESLAQSPQYYQDDYAPADYAQTDVPVDSDEPAPSAVAPWVVLGLALVGLLVIIVLIASLGL